MIVFEHGRIYKYVPALNFYVICQCYSSEERMHLSTHVLNAFYVWCFWGWRWEDVEYNWAFDKYIADQILVQVKFVFFCLWFYILSSITLDVMLHRPICKHL